MKILLTNEAEIHIAIFMSHKKRDNDSLMLYIINMINLLYIFMQF